MKKHLLIWGGILFVWVAIYLTPDANAQIVNPGGGAPLNSPAFTGIPTAPTAANGTNTTQLATTAFVLANPGTGAPINSPSFTGVTLAPTAANGTNTTQIATTAFVIANGGGVTEKARVFMTAGFTPTLNTFVKIPFDTVTFDTSSIYDNTNKRFIPKASGYYRVSGRVSTTGAGTGSTRLLTALYFNGTEISRGSDTTDGVVSSILSSQTNDVIFFNGTTDYVEMFVFSSITAAMEIGSVTMYFTIVGPN